MRIEESCKSSHAIVMLAVLGLCPVTRAIAADNLTRPDSSAQDLANMTAAEKDQLRQQKERFGKLSVQEQERLRQFEHTLAQDPDGGELREVMIRYHNWLKVLQSSQRAEVVGLPMEQRIEKIKTLLTEQADERRRELALQSINREDLDAIFRWIIESIRAIEPKLMEELTPQLRSEIEKSSAQFKMRWLMIATIRNRHLEDDPRRYEKILEITAEKREELVQQLSPTAQAAYRNATTEDARLSLFQNWIFEAMMREVSRNRIRLPQGDLRKMLGSLDPKLRDRLDYMPPDQLLRELEHIKRFGPYRRMGDGEGGFPFKGGWPGGRPGQGGPPGGERYPGERPDRPFNAERPFGPDRPGNDEDRKPPRGFGPPKGESGTSGEKPPPPKPNP